MLRFFAIDDIVKHIKKEGDTELRGEPMQHMSHDGRPVMLFKTIFTHRNKKGLISIYEEPTGECNVYDEAKMKESQESHVKLFEQMKEVLEKEHAVSVKPGIWES